MLTLQGYKIAKKDISNLNHIKSMLNVRPYVPSVFVKPQYVKKYYTFGQLNRRFYISVFGFAEDLNITKESY